MGPAGRGETDVVQQHPAVLDQMELAGEVVAHPTLAVERNNSRLLLELLGYEENRGPSILLTHDVNPQGAARHDLYDRSCIGIIYSNGVAIV